MVTADQRALADVALSEENDSLIDEVARLRALLADIGIDYEYKHPNSALLPRIRAAINQRDVGVKVTQERNRFRDALERIIAADWDGWEFRNGQVVHTPQCIALDALKGETKNA